MSDILVVGGGVCGLATAMLLARDGHEVRVLERDPHEVPASVEEAWEGWDRSGVGQFRRLPAGMELEQRIDRIGV